MEKPNTNVKKKVQNLKRKDELRLLIKRLNGQI